MASTSGLLLGIETSCDDTACALVGADGAIVSSVVSSQLEAHRRFGGVVPEIASREHLNNWPAVSAQALEEAGATMDDLEAVAATAGPGLIGSLLVGLSLGKAIAWGRGLPFYAVHHLEGHLYSPFLKTDGGAADEPPSEFVGLVVSGGHTSIYQVEAGEIRTLAETRDDAMGEVFDKVGKRLGLTYPQGPVVDALAETGDPSVPENAPLAVARCSDGSLDFSYSGLKSQVLLEIEKLETSGVQLPDGNESAEPEIRDLLSAFRQAAVAQLIDRLEKVWQEKAFGSLAVSGGVAANRLLRQRLPAWAEERGVDLRMVPLAYSGDNAAMIAHAALRRHRHRHGRGDDPLAVEAASRVPLA